MCVVICVFGAICVAQEREKKDAPRKKDANKNEPTTTEEKPMSFWMERKLELSQSVFAALASGDFAKLEQSSSQMQLLSKIEGFVRRRSPEYTAHLRSFELSNKEIIKHAKAKNIEGAALAFQQLTISCVGCHKLLRDGGSAAPAGDNK
jgi:hypothetical protein